jgi:thiol-disulfide isomerase/thioredoxin
MRTLKNSFFLFLICACCPAVAQVKVYRIDDLLKRINNADTTYVVNFWATWCKPCIKELPAFDSLFVKSKGTPTKVLLVSLDFKEDLQKRLVPFIKKNSIKAECVLLDESNGNDFINVISPDWSGAIPATLFKKGDKKKLVERPMHLKELEIQAEEFRQ